MSFALMYRIAFGGMWGFLIIGVALAFMPGVVAGAALALLSGLCAVADAIERAAALRVAVNKAPKRRTVRELRRRTETLNREVQ
ncbi:hypothetical protein [Brucella cytisi]|uniref:Uncharacterized protein n=1 Tax=Brucella cytisi TaxID=407152 RepID=A0A1J6HXL3_9HYPH|nr:hypothetical protein [Brucella cytisi]OIS90214.1 hypothetical protein BLA27_27995 [Brucella cytisi]